MTARTVATTPTDVLADGADTTSIAGKDVRKGTVAAFIANATAYEDLDENSEDAAVLRTAIVEAVPVLRLIGVLDVFAPRSPKLAELIASVR